MTGIYLIVASPNARDTPSPSMPASEMRVYYHEAQEGEDVADTANRVANPAVGTYGIGCRIGAVSADDVTWFDSVASLIPSG